MNVFAELQDRVCPVCGASPRESTLFLDASYDPARLGGFSFASRKTPEFMSYKLVRCRVCTTVYAEAAPPAPALADAYAVADYDSGEEAVLAADAYIAALGGNLAKLAQRGRALEIGTGTGVFLERLQDAGFAEVVGVEPSAAAIAAASPRIRPMIREGVFREADFAPGSFDFICCFMTLEHVAAPRELAEACLRLLRPGGLVAFVTHDYTAWLNRRLGRRSPIIDIEHLQLFCPTSLRRLLTGAGFVPERIAPFVNRYPLRYWLRLTPLPAPLKAAGQRALQRLRLDGTTLGANVGNLLSVGRKPA